MPLDQWFHGNLFGYARALLLSDASRRRGVMDVDAVARWLDRGEANGGEFGVKTWMLINLELWFRRYFPEGSDSGCPERPVEAVAAPEAKSRPR